MYPAPIQPNIRRTIPRWEGWILGKPIFKVEISNGSPKGYELSLIHI